MRWIVIYPVDSIIQSLNNWTLVNKCIPANLMLGVTLQWNSIPPRGEYKYS